MAKQTQKPTPVTPDFKDVPADVAQRAAAMVQGGKRNPLKPPADARKSEDQKNSATYTRWSERVQITQAYRSITPKKLLDVVVVAKIRQSKGNTGETVFGHFYLNMSDEVSEGHQKMNDRSHGAIISLLTAIGQAPKGGLKGSLLNRLFPSKGQPGTVSPLNGKSVIANVVQQESPTKDRKTGKVVLDEEDEPIMETRDNIESFLPDTAPVATANDEDGDEDAEEGDA